MKKLIIAVLALSTFSLFNAPPAEAFKFKIKTELPACGNEDVLEKIVKRFNKTEEIYWEERGLALSSVSNPHLHAHNPSKGLQINRNYCHGTAHFENGKTRKVHYLIEEGAGFAGFTWNVEYCIHGLDPWRYNDGRCRVLGPVHHN